MTVASPRERPAEASVRNLSPTREVAPSDGLPGQHEWGQFLTPARVADFMASLLRLDSEVVHLLDAGAGQGALTAAVVRRVCREHRKPREISVTAYEIDPRLIGGLRSTFSQCHSVCAEAGIRFSASLQNTDFIEAVVPLVRQELFAPSLPAFTTAILNPPYRKIRGDSRTRRLLQSAGIETGNLYTAFLALAVRLLGCGGELVTITPRSFCNGPYFRPFRRDFLAQMAVQQVHVFDSRSAAFNADDVLQENIVFHALKGQPKPDAVVISSSSGEPGAAIREHRVPYGDVVSPDDPEQFIHLVTDSSQARAREAMGRFSVTLAELGLSVSTGRVVDFRADAFLRQDPGRGTAPLIYPCHFNGGFVCWPGGNGRKPNAIVADDHTRDLLVPAAIYVLVKRFTSKEERRRVVACIYDPARVAADVVGFENHLNYFHATGQGLSMNLAKGLAAFLNSTLVDVYFRQFNGHTQVNATDLRSLRYPTRAQLEQLGAQVDDPAGNQEELDRVLERELHAGA